MKKTVLMLIIMLLMLTVSAQAEGYDYRQAIGDYLNNSTAGRLGEYLLEDTRELMEENGISDILDSVESLEPKTLFSLIKSSLLAELTQPIKLLATLAGIIIICALLETFGSSLNKGGMSSVFNVIVAVFVASVAVEPVIECLTEAADVIASFSYFITTFIPVFAGVMTASGQPLTAAAYNIFQFWMCQTASELIAAVFVPLLCAYLALAIVSVVCPSLNLSSAVSGIKSFVTWSLTLILTLFVGLLSIQSVVASGGDTVAVRTTKFFISSLIPGVGRTLSDLFSAAQGSIQLVKSTIGVFGVVATLFTFLPIMIRVGAWYAAVYVGGLIADLLGTPGVSRLLKAISATLGIILAVLLFYALLVVISTTIVIIVFKGG